MSLAVIASLVPWGSVLGGLAAFFQRKQELQRLTLEHSHRVELIQLQRASNLDAAQWAAFTASHASASAEDGAGVWAWAKSVRYVTRSALTWVLTLSAVGLALAPSVNPEIAARLTTFAELAVGWWFGTRAASPK